MKFLLDTHAFIWWTVSTSQLSPKAYSLLHDRRNEPYLSLISIWEIQLKLQLGKFQLSQTLDFVVAEQQRINGLKLLPLMPEHIYGLTQLPFHHKDPFDRLLIAQAIAEPMPLMSKDHIFPAYPVQIIW